MGFERGELLSLDELKELADTGECFWVVFESYDPSEYQYEGPANLSPIDDGGDAYYLNEAPNGIPAHKTSFSMGDWYFSDAKTNSAQDFWDYGELRMYRLVKTEGLSKKVQIRI